MRHIRYALLAAALCGCSNEVQVTQPVDSRSQLGATTSYQVTKLSTLGGTLSRGLAINQQGWVAGWSNQSDGTRRAALWQNGIPGLTHLAPTAAQIAEAGGARLEALGVPSRRATSIIALASAVANGDIGLEPGGDLEGMQQGLREIDGIGERLATAIPMRTLYWPDAFPATDRALQRAAGVASTGALLAKAEQWRPWRAYAALHLWLEACRDSF